MKIWCKKLSKVANSCPMFIVPESVSTALA